MERFKNIIVLQQWWSASRVLLGLNGGLQPKRVSTSEEQLQGASYSGVPQGQSSRAGWDAGSCIAIIRLMSSPAMSLWELMTSLLQVTYKDAFPLFWFMRRSSLRKVTNFWPFSNPRCENSNLTTSATGRGVFGWLCVLSHINLVFKGNETTQFQCPLVFDPFTFLSNSLSSLAKTKKFQFWLRDLEDDVFIWIPRHSTYIHSLDREETPFNVPSEWQVSSSVFVAWNQLSSCCPSFGW